MVTETLSAVLEREHRDIDDGLDLFRDGLAAGEWRADAIETASRALRRHIYAEEVLVFPTLRERGLVAPVFVMLQEHGAIWQVLDDLEAREASAASATQETRDVLAHLVELLDQHNMKEERILYPAADSVLSPEQVQAVHDFLANGTMPDGWVTERLQG